MKLRRFAAEVWHRALGYAIPLYTGVTTLWVIRLIQEATAHGA